MAKFMQIIDVVETGQETVLHPETNADYVTTGTTYRVPKIADITDWTNRSKELIEARKGVNKTPNMKILPPLFVYDKNNKWTKDILKIYNYNKEE